MSDTVEFDLDAYLGRIGWEGERVADVATLRAVHLAHSRGIPYENLDAMNRTAPSLAIGDLLDKLVRSRRGGTATSTTSCSCTPWRRWASG